MWPFLTKLQNAIAKTAASCIETDRWVGPALQVSPEDWPQCVGKVLITETIGSGIKPRVYIHIVFASLFALEQPLWTPVSCLRLKPLCVKQGMFRESFLLSLAPLGLTSSQTLKRFSASFPHLIRHIFYCIKKFKLLYIRTFLLSEGPRLMILLADILLIFNFTHSNLPGRFGVTELSRTVTSWSTLEFLEQSKEDSGW